MGSGAKTVRNWEGNLTAPDAEQLGKFFSIGADVLYVVTGCRMPLGTAEGSSIPLSPGQQAIKRLGTLDLSDADTELLVQLARRLASVKKI